MLPKQPFVAAERFIQLKRTVFPRSYIDAFKRFSDMIVMPLICLAMVYLGKADVLFAASTFTTAFHRWKEWIEFFESALSMQRMRLFVATHGGPKIVTNDPEYLPYVWADAVMRSRPEA